MRKKQEHVLRTWRLPFVRCGADSFQDEIVDNVGPKTDLPGSLKG
jgi:hypothetical protein